MIDIIMKYQASIFVDANDIAPTPDNITTLIQLFRDKELIPNTFQELNSNNPVPQTRLQMSSSNGEWVIHFASRRIDIEKNPTNPKGNNLGELAEFCSDVNDYFERITTKFEKKANRLALITSVLLEEMPSDKLNSSYYRLFSPPDFYKDNVPFEWNWRSVAQASVSLDDTEEALNVITTLNRVHGEIGILGSREIPLDRIQMLIDINTVGQNTNHRFDIQSIKNFFNSTLDIHNSLSDEIMDFINE